MAKDHGNSNKNEDDHHLYQIIDGLDESLFKYGISADELTPDGKSPRAEKQVNILNSAVDWIRFRVEILITKIKGRILAKKIENEHINNHELKHGHRPRGNPPKNKLL